MYIQKVKVRNVRGFKKVDLDFTRPDGSLAGWTVLAGRNGSGKSSLLRLMAITALGTYNTGQLHGSRLEGWLREGAIGGRTSVVLVLNPAETPIGEHAPTVEWGVRWDQVVDDSILAFDEETPSKKTVQQRQRYFLAGYGPYRRLTGSSSEANSLMAGSPLVARIANLFLEEAALVEAVTWLRDLHLRHLEGKRGAAELKANVFALLNDELLPDGVVVDDIDSDALWVRQRGAKLPLTEMSDGYRTTAALVMDIVHHLQRSFGSLDVEKAQDERGSFLRVLHEGVVLIDEVDLHLHVSWQKRIGFWLKRHFPNIQFIVTTHSPFVCQAADPKGLIRLPAPGENRPVEHVSEELYNTVVNGSLDEAVLTDLFGLESPYSEQTEKLRERVAVLEARLQSGKATPAEEEEFDRLSSQLPQTLPTAVEQALRKLAADV